MGAGVRTSTSTPTAGRPSTCSPGGSPAARATSARRRRRPDCSPRSARLRTRVTKRAAVAFAEWLSITYGDQGIRVSCLCPQGVNTDMLNGSDASAAGPAWCGPPAPCSSPTRWPRSSLEAIVEERFLDPPPPRGRRVRHAQGRATRIAGSPGCAGCRRGSPPARGRATVDGVSIETPATEIPETPDTESADPGNAAPTPAPSAASTPPADESPFAAMLTELYDGRTAVSSPAVAPDGHRIAFVVSTIDLKENTTRTRVWLAGPGDPAPLTAGPVDGQPEWSPDGRWLAFTSRRGEKDKETTLHVMPIVGPGEVRTVATLPEVVTNLRVVARRQAPGVHQPHPRRPLRGQGRELAAAAQDRDLLHPAQRRGLDRRPAGARLRGAGRRHGHAAQPDARPVPARRRVVAGRLVRRRHVGAAPRRLGPRPRRPTSTSSRSTARSAPSRRRPGIYGRPVGVARRHARRLHRLRRPGVVPAERQRRRHRRRRRPTAWISAGLDRTFFATAGVRSPVWLDDATLLATAEDRGDTHLYRTRRRRLAGAGAAHARARCPCQTFDAAGGDDRHGAGDRRAPRRARDARGIDAAGRHGADARAGSGGRSSPCRAATASDEIDAWIMRPAGFDAAAALPGAAQRPRRPVHAVRRDVLRRGPDAGGGRVRRGDVQPARRQRAAHGVGAGDHRAAKHPTVPGHGLGQRRRRRRDRRARRTRSPRYPFCDPDRVGMLGGSYGGYMATMLAGRFSDRFRAICSERAVNNLLTEEWSAATSARCSATTHRCRPRSRTPTSTLRMSPIRLARDITCRC